MKIKIINREEEELEVDAFILAARFKTGEEAVRLCCSPDERAALTLLLLGDYCLERIAMFAKSYDLNTEDY